MMLRQPEALHDPAVSHIPGIDLAARVPVSMVHGGWINMTLFTYMALDDERTLKASALAPAYSAYKQRVGFLLLLPGRR